MARRIANLARQASKISPCDIGTLAIGPDVVENLLLVGAEYQKRHWAVSKFPTKQWRIGRVGYFYNPVSWDSGIGDRSAASSRAARDGLGTRNVGGFEGKNRSDVVRAADYATPGIPFAASKREEAPWQLFPGSWLS